MWGGKGYSHPLPNHHTANNMSFVLGVYQFEDCVGRIVWEGEEVVYGRGRRFLFSSSPDSVHNDGERHIPYIMIFPNSTLNKLIAWGKSQLSNGMIQEALRPGCFPGIPTSPKVHWRLA